MHVFCKIVLYVFVYVSVLSVSTAQSLEQVFAITVVNAGGNVFVVDGVNRPVLDLLRGGVYTFSQSDASNTFHQIAFKDGTGATYSTGVVTTGTAGTSGAQTVITVCELMLLTTCDIIAWYMVTVWATRYA